MKSCNCEGCCQYKCFCGSIPECKYSGYCDFQLPRDSRSVVFKEYPIKPDDSYKTGTPPNYPYTSSDGCIRKGGLGNKPLSQRPALPKPHNLNKEKTGTKVIQLQSTSLNGLGKE